MRGTSVGVHNPCMPASSNVGWSELFGHTFMHSPQRMHRERKSLSSSEPGGRSSRSCRLLPMPVFACINGTTAAPTASPVKALRRPISGVATSFSLRKNWKLRLLCGQLPTQFMHIRHSDLRHGTPPIGSSPPWQFSRQRLHLSQFDASLCSPRIDQRETAPSKAPKGQIARHHNRVMRRLAHRITRNSTPSTSPCAKCAWRKSSTVACRAACSVSPVPLIHATWLCSRAPAPRASQS